MGGFCFRAQDKVEAAADEDGGVDKGEEIREMVHVESLLEPPHDGGAVSWLMPDLYPLTIPGQFQSRKKGSNKLPPLQQLQSIFSNMELAPRRMMLVIVDEMDYLITRDRAVLHDLFMLTTCPYSICIQIGYTQSPNTGRLCQ